jgi:hypothetical protein
MKLEPKTETKRDGAGKAIKITKEHDIDDVLKYHKEGYSITFDGSDEDFVAFDPDDFAKLPKSLLVYYTTALAEYNNQLHKVTKTIAEAGTPGREFGYDRRVADPGDQLDVESVPKGFQVKWVRAQDDRVEKFKRKGYIVARDDTIKTFANDGSKGGHYVGSESKPEMVAMIISEENFKKNEERAKRTANSIKEATKQKYKEAIEATGLRGAEAELEETFEQRRG